MAVTIDGTSGIVASGSITTQSASGVIFSDSSALTAAASPYVLKNRIINGACAINQRGSSLSTSNSSGYYVDRMWGFSSVISATFSQGSSSGLAGFPNFIRAQRNSGQSAQSIYTGQIVESNNMLDLQGQPISISFWARAGANYSPASSALIVYVRTGTVADQGLSALISGWTGQAEQTSTITLTTSWQKFTITTFSISSTAQELTLFFGASCTGTAGANDYFDVTGIQLEIGSTATPFERRLYGQELALCQRYCVVYGREATYNEVSGTGFAISATNVDLPVTLSPQMRTVPSVSTSGNFQVSDGTAGYAMTSISVISQQSSSLVVSLRPTVASGLNTFRPYRLESANSTASTLTLSAEL